MICSHPSGAAEPVVSYGGDVLGVVCRLCGTAVYGLKKCAWCARQFQATTRQQALYRKYCDRKCMLRRKHRLVRLTLEVQA